MSLKNMTLATGATIAATGGTSLVFADNGVTITNGVQLTVPADTDYQTRRIVTAKVKPASLNAITKQYGKDKKSISYTKPSVLSDGTVVFSIIRCERELHPSISAADAADMNKIGAQLFTDSDTDAFWANGSTL